MIAKNMKKIMKKVRTPSGLARLLEVTPAFAGRVARGIDPVPLKSCRDLEYYMDGEVTAEELRPDVFKPSWRNVIADLKSNAPK